jgi:cytochrome c-type biogenesis protein CcmF
MIANLGYGALVIALLTAMFGVTAALYGFWAKKPNWIESARNAMLLTFPLLSISALCIIALLVTNHFEIEYVTAVTSRSMPTYLRVTALWGGQAGSLVFWSWLMSLFASLVALRDWSRDREFLPWVIVVCLGTLAFFISLSVFVENPFVGLWQTATGTVEVAMFRPAGTLPYNPGDGRGLNPLLRHPGMVIHPPMLYLGFVALVIPYAFAIAALVTGRTDDRWIKLTRRWTLIAWLFLSLGLILGGRWAYDVLGWGGYWGWDPVEVSSLLPWLAATPLLHSVMIQEKRNMFKRWNMFLVIFTFDLMILGTFLTRSGVFSSVHAFAQSAIGPLFFGFIVLTLAGSLALVQRRWDELESENHLETWLSREAMFLYNNFVFIAILAICLWGLLFPVISEAVTGQKITVGPIFYESASGPFWAVLLLLMGVAPMSAWRASTARTLGRKIWRPTLVSLIAPVWLIFFSGLTSIWAILTAWLVAFVAAVTLYEFYTGAQARSRTKGENFFYALWTLAGRNRQRYGGYIIHLGVIMMAVGIMGIEMFQTETQGALRLGETMTLNNYAIRYDELTEFNTNDNRNVARAVLTLYKDGQEIGELYPRRDYFFESEQSMTIPAVRSTLENDFYVLLVNWETISTQTATFKIYNNPLVNWLWYGSFVFIVGTLVAIWPKRDEMALPAFERVAVAARAAGD